MLITRSEGKPVLRYIASNGIDALAAFVTMPIYLLSSLRYRSSGMSVHMTAKRAPDMYVTLSLYDEKKGRNIDDRNDRDSGGRCHDAL